MRVSVRILPWLLAFGGPIILLVRSDFVVWFPVILWTPVLAVAYVARPVGGATRGLRIALALVMLPVLYVFLWEGGWWLIPADLAWLVIELANRGRGESQPTRHAPSG
jgi:hypothetical protein